MDGLDAVMAGDIKRHRAPEPWWARMALMLGWVLVWVSVIVLTTIVGWKVVIPWLVHG